VIKPCAFVRACSVLFLFQFVVVWFSNLNDHCLVFFHCSMQHHSLYLIYIECMCLCMCRVQTYTMLYIHNMYMYNVHVNFYAYCALLRIIY
jgi:hypothetical protein